MIASTICLATRAKSSVVVAYASCPCQGGGKGPETTVAPLEEVVPEGRWAKEGREERKVATSWDRSQRSDGVGQWCGLLS